MALSIEKHTEFSSRLKYAREAAGLSKAELARRVGVTPAYIGQLENMQEESRKNPSKPLLDRLAQILKINSAWLDAGEGEMPRNKFKQFADARQQEMAEKRTAGNVVAEAQARYPTGSLALTAFEETLFYMLRDLPEEARKRVEKDIIMEWTAARRQKPT